MLRPSTPTKSLVEKQDESLDQQSVQVFQQLTGSQTGEWFMEQLYTFFFSRRSNQIVITYFGLQPAHAIVDADQWYLVDQLQIEDWQQEMIRYAVQRLRWKIEHTNVAYSLLPEKFTLGELQKTYEAILGEPLDKRNFRKKCFH